jgi:hypothetical protein
MAEVKDRMSDLDQPSSHEIRDNIRRTRAQMDKTVDAIEEKLSPAELVHEAWGLFRGGSGSSVNRVVRIAKQHPMPTAIIGLGLAWMVYESAGGGQRHAGPVRYAPMPEPGHGLGERGAGTLDAARRGVAAAGRRATETAGAAVDQAADLAGQARDMASDVAGTVRDRASELGRQASELGGQARQGAQDVRVGFWQTVEEQPLVVGVATLAAGLIAGLLLPATPRENELMGKARDTLLDEVKGLGAEALKTGQRVASAAADSLKQSVDAQGVSVEAVADTLRAVGRDVAETVRTEASTVMADAKADAKADQPAPPRQENAPSQQTPQRPQAPAPPQQSSQPQQHPQPQQTSQPQPPRHRAA